MSIIVTDEGFQIDDWVAGGGLFVDLEKFGQDLAEKNPANTCIDIPNDIEVASLAGVLESAAMFRIPFPSFADGRGFSLATALRRAGYRGRLRAVGHVISDQFGFARRCGFDEVEISEAMAERQPEAQWFARIPWQQRSYQDKWIAAQ